MVGITDASKVSARGDGLSLVPCHRPSLFNINAPGARMRDLDVKVTGRCRPLTSVCGWMVSAIFACFLINFIFLLTLPFPQAVGPILCSYMLSRGNCEAWNRNELEGVTHI